MDEKRNAPAERFDPHGPEAWLREALEPPRGAARRVVEAALAAEELDRRAARARWGRIAAAAALLLGLGAMMVLLTRGPSTVPPRPAPQGTDSSAAPSLLITNAGGPVRLVRVPPPQPPLPEISLPPGAGGCTTVLFNRGDVLAVIDTCGGPRIRIQGGV